MSAENVFVVTHKAWFLLCPVWIADIEDEAPTPIPRLVPYCWYDFNLWLNNGLCWLVSFVRPDAVGYCYYAVEELKKPKAVKV